MPAGDGGGGVVTRVGGSSRWQVEVAGGRWQVWYVWVDRTPVGLDKMSISYILNWGGYNKM